jgi:hypothetical protein
MKSSTEPSNVSSTLQKKNDSAIKRKFNEQVKNVWKRK